jgi:hypothetical protein
VEDAVRDEQPYRATLTYRPVLIACPHCGYLAVPGESHTCTREPRRT